MGRLEVAMEHIYVARGIPTDSQTQVGFAGSLVQVLRQRMSDLEGHALALRWAGTIPPVTNMGQKRQCQWPLCEQQFHQTGECEPLLCHRANMESVRKLQGKALLGIASLDDTSNAKLTSPPTSAGETEK